MENILQQCEWIDGYRTSKQFFLVTVQHSGSEFSELYLDIQIPLENYGAKLTSQKMIDSDFMGWLNKVKLLCNKLHNVSCMQRYFNAN